jgi:hypothetical protein
MESRNVATYRAGHEAFNRRDFGAMVKEYAESISWIDQARGITSWRGGSRPPRTAR